MPVVVWTSTANAVDRDSENGFMSRYKDLMVRKDGTKGLNELKPEELSLKKLGLPARASVEMSWLESLQKAFSVCDKAIDLSLRHVYIGYENGAVTTAAHGGEFAYAGRDDGDSDTESPFHICLNADELKCVCDFVSGFDPMTVSFGGKPGPDGMCDELVILVVGKEMEDSEHKVSSSPPLKCALFKMVRSIGELAGGKEFIAELRPDISLLTALGLDVCYHATMVPAVRWIFAERKDYIEFVSNGGILEARYATQEGATARASFGAKIGVEGQTSIPDLSTVLARVDGAIMKKVFESNKHPMKLSFGFDDKGEPSPIKIVGDRSVYLIGQCYDENIPESERYVTRKKGKVVETSEDEALERALKQNKKGNEAHELVTPTSAPAPSEATVMEKIPEQAAVEVETIRQLEKTSDPTGYQELFQVLTRLAVAVEANGEMLTKIHGGLFVTAKAPGKTGAIPQKPMKRKVDPTSPVPDGYDPEQQDLYETDAVLRFLAERKGQELKLKFIKASLDTLTKALVYKTVYKLDRHKVISRIARGTFFVPEDYDDRLKEYLNNGESD